MSLCVRCKKRIVRYNEYRETESVPPSMADAIHRHRMTEIERARTSE